MIIFRGQSLNENLLSILFQRNYLKIGTLIGLFLGRSVGGFVAVVIQFLIPFALL